MPPSTSSSSVFAGALVSWVKVPVVPAVVVFHTLSPYAATYSVPGLPGSIAMPRRNLPASPSGVQVCPPSAERITPLLKVAAYISLLAGSKASRRPVDRGCSVGRPLVPCALSPAKFGAADSSDQLRPASVDRSSPPPAPRKPTPAYTTRESAGEKASVATFRWLVPARPVFAVRNVLPQSVERWKPATSAPEMTRPLPLGSTATTFWKPAPSMPEAVNASGSGTPAACETPERRWTADAPSNAATMAEAKSRRGRRTAGAVMGRVWRRDGPPGKG